MHLVTGTLTVVSSKVLSTGNNALFLSTDDIDIVGGTLSSGTAATAINCTSNGHTVGVGLGTGQLRISQTELQSIRATGLTIGGKRCGSQSLRSLRVSEMQCALHLVYEVVTEFKKRHQQRGSDAVPVTRASILDLVTHATR